jgi:hypothetical protein
MKDPHREFCRKQLQSCIRLRKRISVNFRISCIHLPPTAAKLLIGKHGAGKIHAGIVLGVDARRRGYRVLFTTAADLVHTAVEAREGKRL